MIDRISCFAGDAGRAFAHTVIDELGAGDVAPTPPNYELWATYRSGALPDLNREIDARLRSGAALSAEFCDELFERFFSASQSFDQLFQTGESIAAELAGALAHLRDAGKSAGGYAGELKAVASLMEEVADPQSFQILVRRLIAETSRVAMRNAELERRMEASTRQMESLQASVRQATLEAVSDGLTGLANRKHFDRVLALWVREAAQTGEGLSLVLCDIDHFKRVNDNWGHPVGDQVIRYVASTLRACAPQGTLAARYGGEEYALLLPRTGLAEASAVAERVRERVRARSLSRKSGQVLGVITISAGVAALGPDESGAALVRRADACLYEAKRNGRDRVVTGEIRAAA